MAGPGYGGAIQLLNSRMEVSRSIFSNNIARPGTPGDALRGLAFGGALSISGGEHQIDAITVVSNHAMGEVPSSSTSNRGSGHASGGGIYLSNCVAWLSRSRVDNNLAQGSIASRNNPPGEAQGGGVFNEANFLHLDRCLIQSNQALGGAAHRGHPGANAYGGGIYNAGQINVQNSTLNFNQAIGGRGGNQSLSLPTIGGRAMGGGIYQASNTTMMLLNSTLIMNTARGGDGGQYTQGRIGSIDGGAAAGGGIFQTNSSPRWTNLTFLSNAVVGGAGTESSASPGAQIGSNLSSPNSPTTLFNTILAYGQGAPNVDIPLDGTNNLSSDGTVFFAPSRNRNNTNPLLGPFRYNGGPTPTVAPLPGSPAIDAGSDLVCPPTDQRGQSRPQGAHCDIGAVESGGIPLAGAPPSASRLPDGRVHFEFQGEPARVYTIQSSINLVSWFPVGSTSGDEEGTVVYETQPSGSFRFYRVLPNP